VLSDDLALVQTVDFFAPIVDDPYTFGQIAAANALSDVYAMGGEPLTAMNIVGFPSSKLPMSVLTDILRGGQDKVHEAGALVVGGHSIIDEELKYGLSVTGRVHPKRVLSNANAKPGDRLLLTKPIGTAILATAAKKGMLSERDSARLYGSMSALNRDAARTAVEIGVQCATDVTGFGLLGHASHIATASNVTLRIKADDVPTLPGVDAALASGIQTGGSDRNASYLDDRVEWGRATEVQKFILIDPQTSGGLLLCVPADRVADYLSRVPEAVEVGEVLPRQHYGLVIA
jgi:selenide,water dikinase